MLEFSYLLIYIIYLLRVEGCKVLFQCIKAQTCSHPPILTSGRSPFYTCWCGAKGSSDQKPTSSVGVGRGAGDWCTGQAVGFRVKGGEGVAAHVFSFVYLEKEGQHLVHFQTLGVANSGRSKGVMAPARRQCRLAFIPAALWSWCRQEVLLLFSVPVSILFPSTQTSSLD